MNLQEANRLLTFAKTVDNRKVDDATVIAWQSILVDVDLDDALEAARRHYATSRDYLVPAHITDGAAQVARERAFAGRQEWLDRLNADNPEYDRPGRPALPVVPTEDRSDDVKALVASVVASLPQVGIQERAQALARKERGRPVAPPPARSRKIGGPVKHGPPADAAIAQLATKYLIDGHSPDEVSQRLGISRKWCDRTAARFTSNPGQEAS